jgi:hypothetical protein
MHHQQAESKTANQFKFLYIVSLAILALRLFVGWTFNLERCTINRLKAEQQSILQAIRIEYQKWIPESQPKHEYMVGHSGSRPREQSLRVREI